MKILFLIYLSLQLINSTSAIEVICSFNDDHYYYTLKEIYRCEVTNNLNIISPYLTFIDSVSGSHKSKYNNDHVHGFDAKSKYIEYFPSGLDQIFPNLKLISISYGKLKEVHRSDLRPFPQLTNIYLDFNDIEVIEDDLFDFNPNLRAISFEGSKITNVGQNAFNNLNHVTYLWLTQTPCIDRKAMDNKQEANDIIKTAKRNCVSKTVNKHETGYTVAILNRIEIIINNFSVFQTYSGSQSLKYEELLINARNSIIQELKGLKIELLSTCT